MNDSILTRIKSYYASHKKLVVWGGGIAAVLIVIMVSLYFFAGFLVTSTAERSDSVAAFLHEFEESMPLVPLGGTPEEVAKAMDTHYADYISSDLLAAWKANPAAALGDPAGGPIHTGIRIKSVKNVGLLSYIVKAYVVEEVPVTIPGLGSGMAKRDIAVTFAVAWRGFSWEITEYALGHDGAAPEGTPIPL
jgi:hypothetical protein